MHIGLLKMELHFPGPQSLKEKRKITRSLTSKLRARHNISLAEIGYQDKWQRCLLAAACVSNSQDLAHAQLERVLRDIEKERELILTDYSLEIF